LVIPKVAGNSGIVTGKIFEYVALKRPVLAIGPIGGDAAAILTETEAGQMFDYSDSSGIQSFIQSAMQKSDKKGGITSEMYSRIELTKKLEHLLQHTLGN
jgi:hypothetical protein